MLSVKNLTVKYDLSDYTDKTAALSNICFDVKDGEHIAVIGANGAGKSTLLLTLAGILTPADGEINLDNIKIESGKPDKSAKNTLKDLRSKIGMIFQNPDDQVFMPAVYDDIAFGPRNYGESEKSIDCKTNEILAGLDITHLKNRLTHKLSGGEKRLVALAGVLVMNPSVILMDEPSSFLDPKARRRLIHILQKLPQTLIIATHDLDMALDLCSRTILLKQGCIRADSPAKEILCKPDNINNSNNSDNSDILDECGLELPLSVLANLTNR